MGFARSVARVVVLGWGCFVFWGAPVLGKDLIEGPKASLSGGEESVSRRWTPPEGPTDESRMVRYLAHFAYGEVQGETASVVSMLDLTFRRKLDTTPVGALGMLRIQKPAGSDDRAEIELREAKVAYSTSHFQGTLGRLDLHPLVSPLGFFGAYPLMGVRRAEAALATFPIFFRFGDREDLTGASAPLALHLLYCPSLLPSSLARMDKTQGFFLGQLRCRVGSEKNHGVLRATLGRSGSALFEYSSLSGEPCGSLSLEVVAGHAYALYGEWGVQNTAHAEETSALAAGFRLERLATVGALSLDAIEFEAQSPMRGSSDNVFTGGDPYNPSASASAKTCWYARVKGRLGILQWEAQATTNRDDFTLGRVAGSALGGALSGALGPGREGGDALLRFKGGADKNPGFMGRVGVAF